MHQKELRFDVLTGRQVIVAAGRAERPQMFTGSAPFAGDHYDPFLEGHERDTPGERLALRKSDSAPNAKGWLLRVVANRYPAVGPPGSAVAPDVATGIHDVIVECPDGREHLADLSPEEVTRILFAWQQRLVQIQSLPGIESVCVFRNEGFGAGASLSHCHSQVLATSVVGNQTISRMKLAADYQQRHQASLFEHWLHGELASEERVVQLSSEIAIICPYASRVPWHTRVVPVGGMSSKFEQLTEDELATVAIALLSIVRAHEMASGRSSFNLTLTLPPVASPAAYPWMLDYLPRTSRFAGFELMSDVDILTLAPESAAQQLRTSFPDNISCSVTEALHPVGYEWMA